MEDIKSITPRLILRSEPFGGIVADCGSSNVRFYNHTLFFLIEQLLSGASECEIVKAVKRHFKNTENKNILEHINICRQDIIDCFEGFDKRPPVVDDIEESVPILKAPLDLQIEITKRCNLSCSHCYNRSGSGYAAELSLEYISDIVNQLAEDRLRFVSITGGEPLLHPHFELILKRISEITESVNLSTNGTLVSDKNIDYISQYIKTVNISLDAPVPEVHDSFRHQVGSFNKARAAIKMFVSRGINVVVQTTVFRGNLNLLKDLGTLIQDDGAGSWSVRLPLASGRALYNSQDFFSEDEIREREADLQSLHNMGFNMRVFAGIPVSWSRKEKYRKVEHKNPLISCTAGSVLAAVLADKCVSPCILFSDTDYKEAMPNPRDIKKLWRASHYFNRIRKIRLRDIPLCNTCGHYGKVCETMCRAKSYLFNGDIATPDPDCDYYRSYRKNKNNEHRS